MTPLIPVLGAVFGALALAARAPSRRDRLEKMASRAGLVVRTYSPGDGQTRYRFFRAAGLPPSQSYFGPDDGVFTALGIKEAEAFVRGARSSLGARAPGLPQGLPPSWGVPDSRFLRPGEVPEGWDPNLFRGPFGAYVAFTKLRSGWGLRSNRSLQQGDTITVRTAAGRKAEVVVGPKVWYGRRDGSPVWLYEVAR